MPIPGLVRPECPRTLQDATLIPTVPAWVIEISPPHAQMHLHELFNAGEPPMRTVGEPGIQGAVVIGIHGMGVSTPIAAAVAAITMGLAGDLHIPNDMMLAIGANAMIFAAGVPWALVIPIGMTIRDDGVSPMLQLSIAPIFTSIGMDVGLIRKWQRC